MDIQTSVAIIPPHSVQALAVPLLRQHMPQMHGTFMPHITLLYPFVPLDQLDSACRTLHSMCRSIVPFDITLEGYGHFPDVAYMRIRDAQPVRHLAYDIHAHFPAHRPYDGKYGEEIYPHITIMYLDADKGETPPPLPDYSPITFRVDRIHVNYGIPGEALPWITRDVISLGGCVKEDESA